MLSWKDFEIFDGGDVKEVFTSKHTTTTRLVMKRLGYIVEYERVGSISNNSRLSDIIAAVKCKTVSVLESIIGQDED